MKSTTNISVQHHGLNSGIRGLAVALLGVLGLWMFPILGAAQIPEGFATVGPGAQLDLPPAALVTASGSDTTTNDPVASPPQVAVRPTMDQSAYDALKAGARAAVGARTIVQPDAGRPSATTMDPGPIRLDKNFEGMDETGLGGGFIPPDTHGAISRTQFVEVVGNTLVVYDRNNGALLKRVSLNDLFGYSVPPGPIPQSQIIVEPRVAYDRAADRFIVAGLTFAYTPGVQFLFLGVSQTPDATGTFLVQRLNVRQAPFMPDVFSFNYLILGIGRDAVFVTSNVFASRFSGADLIVFPKSPLYAGQGGKMTVFTQLIGTLTPPIVLDQNHSSFMLSNLPNTPFLAVYELTGAGDPATTKLADPFTINVPTYAMPPSAQQPGFSSGLDTLDTRFINASTQIGTRLFNVHTIALDTLPTPRWYELDLAAHAVAQMGVFFGTATSNDWNASMVVNDSRDAFVTWSSSNPAASREGTPSYFIQVRTSGRLNTDPTGVIPSGVTVFQSPTPYYYYSWGRYSAITLDPNNASCAWGVNEKVNTIFTWGSRFFSACLQR